MNLYLIPLFAMFLASFSIFQEKELKTNMILLTKKESTISFLFCKSIAIQFSLLAAFVVAYFILVFFLICFLSFHIINFFFFIVFLLLIFIIIILFCIYL